jgi:hypothetical protein
MRTRKPFSKIAAWALTLALLIGFMPGMTLTVSAADADTLAATINAHGLTATVSGNTVNVSGTATNNNTLTLNIDSGVTINWDATLSSGLTGNVNVVELRGGGNFIMNGGSIDATDPSNSANALRVLSSTPAFTGNIIINAGKFQSNTGNAFWLDSAAGVTINGGEFINNSMNSAIIINSGFAGTFNISGSVKLSSTTGRAISNSSVQVITITGGNVEIVNGNISGGSPPNGDLVINKEATLTISGTTLHRWDLEIVNYGTIVNNGTFTIAGDGDIAVLTNNGAFDNTNGTLTVNGTYTGNFPIGGVLNGTNPPIPTTINISAIPDVTPPVAGQTPVTAITETAQYTGTVTWNHGTGAFGYSTVYTATITLTPKTGFTLTGVAANSFTVAGATATNPINSGVITAVFPATAAALTYTMSASALTNFDSLQTPYTQPAAQTVTITNTGTSAITLT